MSSFQWLCSRDSLLTKVQPGFDAITGTLSRIDIRNAEDQNLSDVLKKKLSTAYGLTVPKFPNFFLIFGPQAPFANGPLIIDLCVDWIGKTIAHMKDNGQNRVESTKEAGEQWTDHVDLVYESLVIKESAKEVGAWYVGANVENKTRGSLFYFGGAPAYAAALDKERAEQYPGHTFSTTAIEAM